MALLFGTAGIPVGAKERSTEGGIKYIKALGLSCMEIEFVRGVHMSENRAYEIKRIAELENIALTVHAPYFINLNSIEHQKIKASKQRIFESARIGEMAGAKSVTFHAAYYGAMASSEVYKVVKDALIEIVETLRAHHIEIDIRPETTGKGAQFGTFEELVNLSQEIPEVKPCIDFAHIYARELGKRNSYDEFMRILDYIDSRLGPSAIKDMHIHVSGIHYGAKGELNHLNVQDKGSKFEYKELMRALHDKGVGGYLISESPNLEADAILFKKVYEELR